MKTATAPRPNMEVINQAVKDGRLIVDSNGIIKTYAWHSRDERLKVTCIQHSISGRMYTIYTVQTDENKERTMEYSKALQLTETYLKSLPIPA